MKRVLGCAKTLGFLFLLINLWGCEKSTKPKPQSISVSLATGKNIWCCLVLVAKEKGFFEEEGLNVSLNYQDAGRYCMDALLSKSVDFAAVVEANIAYVGFTGNRSPVVVAEIVASSCGIVARKSKSIGKEADLRGKSIAYTPATGAEPFLFRFLAKHGIQNQEVKLRKMQPKALQPALVAGEVDAAATWEPYIYNCIKAMRGDAIEFRDPDAFTGYMMLAVRREWAGQKKDIVTAMLRALRRAETFVVSNQSETKNLLARKLEMDMKDVEGIWPYFEIKLRMNKPALIRAIRYVGENARATDPDFADKALPNYDDYVDESFLTGAAK
jgi:ABC-type nitrate/sulfonate/bicarbonate transport system substrate-binding protein